MQYNYAFIIKHRQERALHVHVRYDDRETQWWAYVNFTHTCISDAKSETDLKRLYFNTSSSHTIKFGITRSGQHSNVPCTYIHVWRSLLAITKLGALHRLVHLLSAPVDKLVTQSECWCKVSLQWGSDHVWNRCSHRHFNRSERSQFFVPRDQGRAHQIVFR
jgi:hypothetical protein